MTDFQFITMIVYLGLVGGAWYHGWHLGNDRKWGKHTLFERSLKSALIIKLPGKQNKNKKHMSLIEISEFLKYRHGCIFSSISSSRLKP